MIADYFILRKTELDVAGLYSRSGPYGYGGYGYNPPADADGYYAPYPGYRW